MSKVYDADECDVIDRSSCTWCGAEVGEPCRPTRGSSKHDLPGGYGTAHAQRWYDLWNATHGPDQFVPVSERAAVSR